MPVDFLTTEQELNYGRYVAEPNDVQLARYFHLDERDLAFINQRRGRHNRLGIALQLTTARFLGTFLTDLTRVLPGVQQFVAVQLNIRRPEVLTRYAERVTTLREHTALIKEYYGYHEFGDFPWSFRLKRLLYTRAWLSNERPGLMFDFATAWLLQNKVLLPGATTLVRLVSEIRERANQRLWKKLAALPDSWQTARVTELLDIPEGQRTSPLEQLKKGPVTVSGPAFTEALERYIRLRNLEFSRLNFTGLPAIQLRNLARYAGMASVKYIARMPQQRKLAVLTAFVKAQETAALDEAVDVLDMLILDITRAAKKTGQKKRLRTLKDLDRAALILARACSLLLDEQADDAELRETIFNSIPKSRLAESVSKVNELARPQNNNFHDEMVEQYGRVKRFLPAVLRDLHFQAAPAGEHTLSAIHYLTELNGSKKRILDNAPEHIITGPWKRLVYDAEGRIQRAGYSLCLLERLQDALRRRDIWLENSDRWGNPREKLLQGEEWQAQRVPVCRALGHPTDGHKGVQQLAVQLDETWKTAGSLKLGTIHASELIRSLLKSSRPSGLAQAIMEVGRVNKTLYLLNYIDDEDYRRRILTQLNRGEGRHAVARAICYGQRGEIRKRYREGQEDQLGALGLVTNAVVLWNTLYMQEALSWIRSNGEEIGVEDIARLSPLMHGHINMLGHYTFTLPEDILKGELRELNFNLNNELTS
ncbi:Tn3 family transposase [Klebsiella pneumoniae]